MRLFLALPISLRLQNKVLEWKNKFKGLPVRWLAGKNPHITLIPPWEEYDLNSAKKKLKQLEDRFKSFGISFHNVSFGPNSRQPRLIWAEGNALRELLNLKNECEKVFAVNRGIRQSLETSAHRDFFLHLTLARLRPEDLSKLSIRNLNEKILWKEKIEKIVLMESRLSSREADYKILDEVYVGA